MASPIQPSTTSDAILPLGIPAKFTSDGTIQRYPGNTIICHVPLDSPVVKALKTAYDAYSVEPWLRKYIRLMPPESWHMTVFDGIREREAEPGMWPEGSEKLSLPQAVTEYAERLKALGPKLEREDLGPPYRMRVCGFEAAQCGMGLDIEGETEVEEKRLRKLRDRLAETLGFRAPNHDVYRFHITISYLLCPISGQDKLSLLDLQTKLLPEALTLFELGSLEFCVFEDMDSFSRVLYFGGQRV